MSYNSRGKRDNNWIYVLRIIVACVLICVSLIGIYITFGKIVNIKIAENITIKTLALTLLGKDTIKIEDGVTIKNDDVKFFIKQNNQEQEMLFIKDETDRTKCKKPDGSFAKEEWLERVVEDSAGTKKEELYYFDTSGYGFDGTLRRNGQIYTLEDGKLKKIVKDKAYSVSENQDKFSSVVSTSFEVYLESNQNEYGYYPIRYTKFGDEDDYLGTENDIQYSSSYMLRINDNMIYYLSIGSKIDYAGKLFRMRPNGSLREWVGSSVEGYIVLSSDVVYYYDGVRIIKAKVWNEEEVKVLELTEEDLLPKPNSEEDENEETTKNNFIDSIIDVLPLPIKNDDETKNNTIDYSRNETSTINRVAGKEDAIIVEPLPIPKETVVDKNDVRSRDDYVIPKIGENVLTPQNTPMSPSTEQRMPNAKNKEPLYSKNAPGA